MRDAGLMGVRLAPSARSSGADPYAIWRRASALGAIVSVRGPFEDVITEAFELIVATFPGVRFRFEHLGWLKLASEPAPYDRFRRFLRLAAYPNTFAMLSGFYLNSTGPYPYEASAKVVDLAYRAFGADRLMWSGDWNRPNLQPGEYRREIDLIGGAFPLDFGCRSGRDPGRHGDGVVRLRWSSGSEPATRGLTDRSPSPRAAPGAGGRRAARSSSGRAPA